MRYAALAFMAIAGFVVLLRRREGRRTPHRRMPKWMMCEERVEPLHAVNE